MCQKFNLWLPWLPPMFTLSNFVQLLANAVIPKFETPSDDLIKYKVTLPKKNSFLTPNQVL